MQGDWYDWCISKSDSITDVVVEKFIMCSLKRFDEISLHIYMHLYIWGNVGKMYLLLVARII